jgi:dihydroorotate dehydrogenase
MINAFERLAMPVLSRLDPERAHRLAIQGLKLGLAPTPGPLTSLKLQTDLAGLVLPNPVGLAAGFDKNAEVVAPLLRSGFGFIEVGAVTPAPQDGNPKPRLFRLPEDKAAINRFGFNSTGMLPVSVRLSRRPSFGIVGVNLGANKDSTDRIADFVRVLGSVGPFCDFATINISSPNTEKLRDLQSPKILEQLLNRVLETRDTLTTRIPIFLKISPDLSDGELEDIAEVSLTSGVSGIVCTNTTTQRMPGLKGAHRDQRGGLSGEPLFELSTRILAKMFRLTEGEMPLIGVGGVSTAEQAYAKIKAGATAVQLYTGMVYRGTGLANRVAQGIHRLLTVDGHDNVAGAVGTGVRDWL